MFKNTKVVMLPTFNESNIIKCIKDYNSPVGNTVGTLLCQEVIGLNKEFWQFQHLYILSDEEPKMGDWVFNTFFLLNHLSDNDSKNTLFKCDTIGSILNAKKFKDTWKKIISSTDKSLGLPIPTDGFIRNYCELGGVDEVMVEYEYGRLNSITEAGGISEGYKLNVYSDGTINTLINNSEIKPVTKTSWNREELEEVVINLIEFMWENDRRLLSNESTRRWLRINVDNEDDEE